MTNLTAPFDECVVVKIAHAHKNVRFCAITTCAVIEFFVLWAMKPLRKLQVSKLIGRRRVTNPGKH